MRPQPRIRITPKQGTHVYAVAFGSEYRTMQIINNTIMV